jgi:hypothetical protein
MCIEPEVTGAPKLGYDEVLHPDWFESHAGLDESGKGDFFGPVIAATVIAGKEAAIEAWQAAGVQDSKKIARAQIIKLDRTHPRHAGRRGRDLRCMEMGEYNELMAPAAGQSQPPARVAACHALDAGSEAQARAVGPAGPVHRAAARAARAGEEGVTNFRPADAHQG